MASAVLLIGTAPFANCNGKVRSKLWWCCAEACRATPQLWGAGEVESERLLIAADAKPFLQRLNQHIQDGDVHKFACVSRIAGRFCLASY